MKRCGTCQHEKPLEEFYRNASQPDGRAKACAECSRAYQRARSKSPRVKAVKRAWRQSESGRSMVRRIVRDPAYKIKKAAHRKVERAIKAGILVPPESCEACSETEGIQAHHDDYSKPLTVRWLCVSCHREWHRINGEGKGLTRRQPMNRRTEPPQKVFDVLTGERMKPRYQLVHNEWKRKG